MDCLLDVSNLITFIADEEEDSDDEIDNGAKLEPRACKKDQIHCIID